MQQVYLEELVHWAPDSNPLWSVKPLVHWMARDESGGCLWTLVGSLLPFTGMHVDFLQIWVFGASKNERNDVRFMQWRKLSS